MPRFQRHDLFLFTMGVVWAAGATLLVAGWRDPHFRPWEQLRAGMAFLPNQQVAMEASGDLAFKIAEPSAREPRRVVFTTDDHGFRNPRSIEAPRVVVIGDSYVGGAGLSDEDTLPEQLSQILGEPVYNFACSEGGAIPWFTLDERFVKDAPDYVVWAPAARNLTPNSLNKLTQIDVHPTWSLAAGAERLERLSSYFKLANGIGRSCVGAYWRLFDSSSGEVLRVEIDGAPALAMSLSAERLLESPAERQLDQVVEAILRLDLALEAVGSRLVLAPIPPAGAVYLEAFPEPEQRQVVRPDFVLQVMRRVQSRVRCVNLLPRFVRERFPYLYWRDDTHWRPRAVRLAAEELAEVVRR